jgi:hypothetical protein
MKGRKTGGRARGVPNKRTVERMQAESKRQQDWATLEENNRPDNRVPERRYRAPPPRVIIGARGRG